MLGPFRQIGMSFFVRSLYIVGDLNKSWVGLGFGKVRGVVVGFGEFSFKFVQYFLFVVIVFGCVAYWLPHLLCVNLLTAIPFPLFHCLNIFFYSTCNSSKVFKGIEIHWTNIYSYNNVVTFHHQLFLLHCVTLMLILLLSQLLPLTLHRQNQTMQNKKCKT